ncbi:MAG: hypothetical protein KA780_04895 [Prolixibacteraceae bacterium]|jgi:hypothetical protein|nr:hypothetical protein [Prolixibacteraceae bacterium]NLX29512.1 hypothetical protein [Bacteroidales bacterium]HNQ37015.1 hypothetical protein [Prolixibacteraceae bacterium]HOY51449.1 hypothetical protein [Prolixibacteraceae bacterium]HPJ79418.1 hypothetical protein [Prolixibacteraceae bacterium]
MKTIATLVLVLSAMVAGAVEKPRLEVYPVNEGKAIVALANERPARMVVSLSAGDGSLVYHSESKESQTGYRKLFDFSGLEDGRYVLSVKVNSTTVKRPISIDGGALRVGDSEFRFDPYFSWSDDVLKISYLNFDGDPLRVTINGQESTVYEGSLGRNFSVMAGYDLSALDRGQYTVVVAGGDKQFVYTLNK